MDLAHSIAPWDDTPPSTAFAWLTLHYSRRSALQETESITSPGMFAFPHTACTFVPEATWARITQDGAGQRFQSGVVIASASPLTGYTSMVTCSTTTGSGDNAGDFYYFEDVGIRCIPQLTCGGAYIEPSSIPVPDAPGWYYNLSTRKMYKA